MVKTRAKKANANGKARNSEKNSLLLYLQEINRIPLLSKAEEEETARLAASGNPAARERIVNANLRFVVTIAKKYQGSGLPLEDLISEGNMGLLNAVDYFDVEKGFRFITYAVWWIRQAIIKAIQEKGRMIRLPSNKSNELARVDKARQYISNEPDIKEIATILEIPEKKAAELSRICHDVLSLDDQVSTNTNSSSIKDFIEDEVSKTPIECAINSMLRDELERAIGCLEQRAADVIRSRFGFREKGPLTLKEIGARYNLSRERVRQIEKWALGQLQQSPERNKLKSYIAG